MIEEATVTQRKASSEHFAARTGDNGLIRIESTGSRYLYLTTDQIDELCELMDAVRKW